MLFRPPRIHVDTDFRYQTQCGRFVDTMDLGQIHAANPEGLFSNRKVRLIASLLFYFLAAWSSAESAFVAKLFRCCSI